MIALTALQQVEPALRALGVETLAGFQVFAAADVAALHHPPLNPDVAALLLAPDATDWAALRRVLLNQYPGEHAIQVVRGSGESMTVDTMPLAALDGIAAAGWSAIYLPPLDQASSFERFQETIAHLRAPEGCPWDRKQTHSSLRPYLLEETYEVLDALDRGDVDALREELGDLLLQIVLHSQIAVDDGEFRMADIVAAINAKIVRRHPHVWGQRERQRRN